MLRFILRFALLAILVQAAILWAMSKCVLASSHDRPDWADRASFTFAGDLLVVGIGTAKDHPGARQRAYWHGLDEITNYSRAPVPAGVEIATERVYEVRNGDGTITVYRLMRVALASLKTAAEGVSPKLPATRPAVSPATVPEAPLEMAPQAVRRRYAGPLPEEPPECSPTDTDCQAWIAATRERWHREATTPLPEPPDEEPDRKRAYATLRLLAQQGPRW